jgi:hypothetical protein
LFIGGRIDMDAEQWFADTSRLHAELREWAQHVIEWGERNQQMPTARSIVRFGCEFLAGVHNMELWIEQERGRGNGTADLH